MIRTAVAAAVLVGCVDTSDVSRECLPDETRATERAEFVIRCAEAANPRSDEEGEDLVRQCERTADHLFCHRVWAIPRCHNCLVVACEHAPSHLQSICTRAGWGRQ